MNTPNTSKSGNDSNCNARSSNSNSSRRRHRRLGNENRDHNGNTVISLLDDSLPSTGTATATRRTSNSIQIDLVNDIDNDNDNELVRRGRKRQRKNDVNRSSTVAFESSASSKSTSMSTSTSRAATKAKYPILNQWKVTANSTGTLSASPSTSSSSSSSTIMKKRCIQGRILNHPDPTIQNDTIITIRKFELLSSSAKKKERLSRGNVIVAVRNGIKYQLGTPFDEDEDEDECQLILPSTTTATKTDKSTAATVATAASGKSKTSSSSPNKSSSSIITATTTTATTTTNSASTPVERILEVFPDMHLDHIHKHLLQVGFQQHVLQMKVHHQQQQQQQQQQEIIIPPPPPPSQTQQQQNYKYTLMIQQALGILANQTSYPKSNSPLTATAPTSKTLSSTTNNNNNNNNNNMSTYNKNNASKNNASNTRRNENDSHDYSSTSSTYERNTTYKQNAFTHLSTIFPFLSTNGITALLQKFQGRYYFAFMYIIDKVKQGCKDAIENNTITTKMLKQYHNNSSTPIHSISFNACSSSSTSTKKVWNRDEIEEYQYWNILNLCLGQKLLPEQIKALEIDAQNTNHNNNTAGNKKKSQRKIKTTLTKPRHRLHHLQRQNQNPIFLLPNNNNNPILQNEIKYTNSKFNEWKTNIEDKIYRSKLRHQSELDGTSIECNCCYSDCAFEEMVSCLQEGHLFCVDCIRKHAEEQIFGCGKLSTDGELVCMHLDGCTSHFAKNSLERALPVKVIQKYDELQATQVLEMVGMKDLCKCPKCDFQAIVPESQSVFDCPTCQYQSCRKCGEESHIPLRCEEVEKKNETCARIRVEEAMTKARIRHCPNGCKQPFYKVEGCNKMTCPTCKSFICYLCRQLITKTVGYKHYCQTPHCQHKNCKKCPLYSNAEEDDRLAAKEAGLKTMKEIQTEEEKRRNEGNQGTLSETTTKRINVEDMLESPTKAATQSGGVAVAGRPVAIRHHGYLHRRNR